MQGCRKAEVESLALATIIAEKSPIAVMGIKKMLNYSRDHTLDDSLKFGLTWNLGMAQTKDIAIAGQAFLKSLYSRCANIKG